MWVPAETQRDLPLLEFSTWVSWTGAGDELSFQRLQIIHLACTGPLFLHLEMVFPKSYGPTSEHSLGAGRSRRSRGPDIATSLWCVSLVSLQICQTVSASGPCKLKWCLWNLFKQMPTERTVGNRFHCVSLFTTPYARGIGEKESSLTESWRCQMVLSFETNIQGGSVG